MNKYYKRCCLTHPFALIFIVTLIVVGSYFVNFNLQNLTKEGVSSVLKNLSQKTGAWGEFGDYVGGILNPIIAAFAFYLIYKSYELQKRELKATRRLLKISTNAQKEQIKLAALTALLNSHLVKIDLLSRERNEYLETIDFEYFKKYNVNLKHAQKQALLSFTYRDQFPEGYERVRTELYSSGISCSLIRKLEETNDMVIKITNKHNDITWQIEAILKAQ